MAWLEVENLTLFEKGQMVLSNISFSIDKGTITFLSGRNGSGKSMLLKSLKGLLSIEGNVRLDGKLLDSRRKRLSTVGLVFQETALQIVGATVEKDIAFGPENQGLSPSEVKQRVDMVIENLDLGHIRKKSPSELSGGELRKLSIAGVIAMSPSLILLDEPLANLDYPATINVIKTLIKLKEEGFTIIVASHEVEKLLAHTDRTLIMKKGRLICDKKSRDSLDDLRANDIYIPKQMRFEDLTWIE